MPVPYVLFAILAVAAILQLTQLGAKSLWDDEVFTVSIAAQPSLDAVLAAREISERQPPLHYLLLHGWMQLAGTSDTAVRLPSAFFSVASVGLLAWLGWRLAGWRVALLASYLLAVSPFLLLYGRMARYYALALFLVLLSTALLIEALRRQQTDRRTGALWIAYGLAAIAMLLTSYPTAAVLIGQNLFVGLVLRTWRRQSVGRALLRRWLVVQAIVVAAFAGWLVVEWGRLTTFGLPATQFSIQGWSAVVLKITFPLYAFSLGETIFPWHPFALIALGLLTVLVPFGLLRLRALGVWGWLPLVGLFGTLLITVLAFQVFVRDLPFITLGSRAIGALPFLLLILAIGLAALPFRLRALVLIGLTAAFGAAGWNYYTGQQFINPVYAVPTKEIVQTIVTSSRPTDLIVADRDVNVGYYYRPRLGDPKLLLTRDVDAVHQAVVADRPSRVWLITFGRDRTRAETPEALESWLDERYQVARWWGYVPENPIYSRIKTRIQGFPDYQYKVTVRLFEQ